MKSKKESICLLLIALFALVSLVSCTPEQEEIEEEGFVNSTVFITITFDNAYTSQYFYSYMLDNYGFKAVYCAPAGLLDGLHDDSPVMSPALLKDLALQNHEVASETLNNFGGILGEEQYEDELRLSKEELLNKGFFAETFCYPYYADIAFKDLVVQYYERGRSLEPGINALPVEDWHALRSNDITHLNNSMDYFLSELDNHGGWLIINIREIDINESVQPDTDLTVDGFRVLLEKIYESGVPVITIEEAYHNPVINRDFIG
ncbi:MAG: hypothetical protein ABIE94_00750 [archaeon]